MVRRDCESIRPLISAFFDGDLTPSESVRLHQHLATCEDCRQIVDEYQRIRSDFRELPPSPQPPESLTDRIRLETVERPNPNGFRRVFGATTAKVGLSTAAALAIVAIIGAFLLVRSYNQSLTPTVVASVPASAQNWPVYQPIKIQFNKPMDHVSVEENLQIWPPGERDRIPMSWQGNTLILGSSSSQSSLFLPDTAYQVMVLGTAQDAFGHEIGKTWSVSFRTSPVSNTAQTSTQTPSGTSSATPTSVSTQAPVVVNGASSPTPSAGSTVPATSTSPGTGTPETPGSQQSPTPIPSESATGTATSTATTTPTPTPTQPAETPQATPTAAPATPTATATTPPATPAATPSATPSATAPATSTPTPAVVPVTGAFGSVYWANADVQDKLGAPQGPEVVINAAELGFQRGTMYERFDTNEIYVLFANGQWIKVKDTWNPSDGEGGGAGPDQGLWIPKESFWKVWNSDPSLASTIGYAIEENAHLMTKSGGAFQNFANGTMLYSDQGFVYVVYYDGSWALYPDTSGHGDLLTPTPEPRSTATPADSTPAPSDTPQPDPSTTSDATASSTP